MTALLQRLLDRKLVQWAIAYLAGAWLLLQVLDLLAGFFGWPSFAGRVATVLLGVGFLGTLVAAWFHGEKGEQKVGAIELAMFAVLCVIAGTGVALLGGDQRGQSGESSGTPPPETAAAVEQSSIAVLPFVNMSSDPEQEFFSDGLTEELLNVLAKLPALRVAARTSSFSFKGKNVPVDSIGRTLKVAHILEGSVRKAGDRLRITAQLVRVDNGYHLWSETYDREVKDVFAVQDEIAKAIAGTLQLRLAGASGASLAGTPTSDPEAFELYLKGRHLFENRRTAQDLLRAIGFFERAIGRDSTYAQAYAGLAQIYALLPIYGVMRHADALPRAVEAAERAVRLDGALAEAYTALGMARMGEYRWREAERAYRRAIELNPNDPTAHAWYGRALLATGQGEAALAEARRARELDPLSSPVGVFLGWSLVNLQRYDEAFRALQATLDLDPTHPVARQFLGRVYLLKGERAAGIRELERALADSPERHPPLVGYLGHAYAVSGRHQEARQLLDELHRRDQRESISRPALARIYLGLGETDEALRRLGQAVEEKDATMALYDPEWEPLQSDPRFRALLTKMGLER